MKEKITFAIILLLLSILLLGSLTWLNTQLISRVDAGSEFLVPWMSARSFLFEHTNPYLTVVAEQAQRAIYGHRAKTGEYPYYLNIPFYQLFFYMPFALIEDFELSLALWMSFAQIALFGVGFLSILLSQWKPSPLNAVLFFLTLFFSFYGLYPVIGGSGAIFTALVLLLALFSIRQDWDEVLGILLVFGTFQIAKGGLLFILLIFWAYTAKRSRALTVATMTLLIFSFIAFLLLPSWFTTFFAARMANARAPDGILFANLLQHWQALASIPVAQVVRWLLALVLFLEWRAVRGKSFEHLLWVSGLSVAVVPFLNIHTSPLFYSILFLPLALVFKIAQNRWERYARWLITLALLLILGAWGLFLKIESALQIIAFLLPSVLLIALYWMRWWNISAPRTWVDEANTYKR